MITLVRIDDRLLHGQIICAWVPYVKADALVVASDEAAGDTLVRDIMTSCSCPGLSVDVRCVEDIIGEKGEVCDRGRRVILIFGNLRDAMRAYEEGIRFAAVNIGNIHHEENGRKIAPYVTVNREDEELMERFTSLGVAIEIRDVPASAPVKYVSGAKG